ncbi:class I adenylate-forming enzyme family protein [Leucobacter denitrificans]|uniref:AMP-binding protein n=1 Tax=Leucobacter denitrificans TaxID=683042 RepID=A0A7G9S548_9MICO|nr:AMP-binding protein [Leucobacter denitrificans]QNN62973.1 AMP-binding protein [Leucobacter denitrificans]
MNITSLLDMSVTAMSDRTLIGNKADGLSPAELRRRALAGATYIRQSGAKVVGYLGGNGPEFPVALFSAAYAGVPFLPLNFRLSNEQLDEILARQDGLLLLTRDAQRIEQGALSLDDFELIVRDGAEEEATPSEADDIAVILMTSGTTAAPKSALLRHQNLASYILSSVDFASAEPDSATIVSVPPYHIAAVANMLSNLFAGRRIVYLDHFTADEWLDVVRREGITNAMVVPTMLSRIVHALEESGQDAPETLRGISYGGAKVPTTVLQHALEAFPNVGFVNAYGLTETASSIAILGPEDHRTAMASDDPEVRARLSSVGRALPGVEIQVQDENGEPCAPGVEGDIVVRGPQVAGEYRESGSLVNEDGWFRTRDLGYIDSEGFIFVKGRADDTIIRGGENIAPAEIEDVLFRHEAVADVAVAGVPNDEWGFVIAAFIVVKPGASLSSDEVRAFARQHLRSSKTPDEVHFTDEIPTTPTGKVLRRHLVDGLLEGVSS